MSFKKFNLKNPHHNKYNDRSPMLFPLFRKEFELGNFNYRVEVLFFVRLL